MSYISFQTPDRIIYLRGAERFHMRMMCVDMLSSAIGWKSYGDEHPLKPYIPADNYVHHSPSRFAENADLWMRGYDGCFVTPDGEYINTFDLALNTAYVMGSDPVKLAARLHGQCELHCYVENKNKLWLAEIIRKGLKLGIFREGMRWDEVIDLLLTDDGHPVITSYSVTPGFPDRRVTNWEPTPDEDEGDADSWYALPKDEQWSMAMAGLRAISLLELKPDNWDDYTFTHGVNGYQLMADAIKRSETTGKQL